MAIALIASMLATCAYAGDLVSELAERQKGLVSVRAEFQQEKRTSLRPKPIKSKGTIAVRPPWGVRWEYKGSMVVVYDCKDLYLHYTELDDAEKIEGAEGFVGPLVFDIKSIASQYNASAEQRDGAIALTLLPRKPMPFVGMEMLFPEGAAFPSEVSVKEEGGDTTLIRFSNTTINSDIPRETFVFKAPPGVKLRVRKAER